jgi:5-methylcytosine-specific restriction protein A
MSIIDDMLAANEAQWKAQRAPLGRPVKEWRGKTAASMPPPTVRQRIFETWGGICYLSGVIIDPVKGFDLEHIVPIADGGLEANRESNLRPALRDPHIIKTAREKKERSEANRKRRYHAGTRAAARKKIESAPFAKATPQKRASKPLARDLPPRRAMFVEVENERG